MLLPPQVGKTVLGAAVSRLPNSCGEAPGFQAAIHSQTVRRTRASHIGVYTRLFDRWRINRDAPVMAMCDRQYLQICIDPYPNPISYKGEYYQRSGSTNQSLKGAALDRFLLRRYGRTWDGSPLPGVAVSDLSPSALAQFRKLAERSGRLDAAALKEPDAVLLDKLKLNERQRSVVPHLKLSRTMTNAEYRGLTGASVRTATRDLDDLVSKGVLERSGEIGRGVLYRLAPKRASNAPNAPSENRP